MLGVAEYYSTTSTLKSALTLTLSLSLPLQRLIPTFCGPHYQDNLAFVTRLLSDRPGNEPFEGLCNYNLCIWDPKYAVRQSRPCSNIVAVNNVAAGSYHVGFCGWTHSCELADASAPERGNVVKSPRVGTFLKHNPASTCSKASGYTVVKTNEVGLLVAGSPQRLLLSNIIAADNLIGIKVRPVIQSSLPTASCLGSLTFRCIPSQALLTIHHPFPDFHTAR